MQILRNGKVKIIPFTSRPSHPRPLRYSRNTRKSGWYMIQETNVMKTGRHVVVTMMVSAYYAGLMDAIIRGDIRGVRLLRDGGIFL